MLCSWPLRKHALNRSHYCGDEKEQGGLEQKLCGKAPFSFRASIHVFKRPMTKVTGPCSSFFLRVTAGLLTKSWIELWKGETLGGPYPVLR